MNQKQLEKVTNHLSEKLPDLQFCDFGPKEITNEHWREFRELHYTVSGRKTRSEKSWMSQLSHIRLRHAFLITLRDGRKLVGGGFFYHTRDHASYATAAYDRAFDKLGHLTQWIIKKN